MKIFTILTERVNTRVLLSEDIASTTIKRIKKAATTALNFICIFWLKVDVTYGYAAKKNWLILNYT